MLGKRQRSSSPDPHVLKTPNFLTQCQLHQTRPSECSWEGSQYSVGIEVLLRPETLAAGLEQTYDFTRLKYPNCALDNEGNVGTFPLASLGLPPLTTANLERFNSGMALENETPPLNPSTPSRTSKAKSDPTTSATSKLETFGIFIGRKHQQPPDLVALVKAISTKPRTGQLSPNSANVAKLWESTQFMGEESAIMWLVGELIGEPALSKDERAYKYVCREKKINFPRGCVPTWKNESLDKAMLRAGLPETPQPDICFGYLTRRMANAGRLDAPFSEELEATLINNTDYNRLSEIMHFPFLTWQWKGSDGSNAKAQAQGARDGAAVVANLHQFYQTRGIQHPSASSTCHFSGTATADSCYLYVHWRLEAIGKHPTYHMDRIASGNLDDADQIAGFRRVIRNIFDHAIGARLTEIKNSIAGVAAATGFDDVRPAPSSSSGTAYGFGSNKRRRVSGGTE
ncbi:hypothetical protein AOQ84DRAFT_370614 [Glonium stellatum]|uniref:DUF7924 domain-containing protein n=1 Tax=Glonium stellatum TaxID=574774 RepID=A0A8E2FDV9_9PEZI|nr:hypothetical protein AOQ84DRAFT_370614 [Glonium stellatum]